LRPIQFEMFVEEYDQIKKVIEQGDSLEEVIHKAFEEEGESLIPIIEGWLETEFKRVVKKIV
jgi:copper homeostasis protein CutC